MNTKRQKMLGFQWLPALSLAAFGLLGTGPIAAQEKYPTRNVEIVVPFAAGGGTDVLARLLADGLSRRLGQTFVVLNRPGANTNVGTALVVKSRPDGHTLAMASIGLAANPSLYRNLGFDPLTDLAPISLIAKVGDAVKAGAPIAKLGNTGPSEGPHLHFGLLNKPDPIAGRSLPFVFDSFTLDGAVDFDTSKGDRLVIRPDARRFGPPIRSTAASRITRSGTMNLSQASTSFRPEPTNRCHTRTTSSFHPPADLRRLLRNGPVRSGCQRRAKLRICASPSPSRTSRRSVLTQRQHDGLHDSISLSERRDDGDHHYGAWLMMVFSLANPRKQGIHR
jgi:hypothetical protein